VDNFLLRHTRPFGALSALKAKSKTLRALATFVTDVLTVVTLGLMFTPFTIKTLIALGGAAIVLVMLPWLTPRFRRDASAADQRPDGKSLCFSISPESSGRD